MQIVEIMEKTFEAESGDIALYLAMSQKAADEGHSEIALYLYSVAMDEAHHAAEFAMLLGKIKDTKSNLTAMLEDEIITEKDKEIAAKIALSEGNEEAFQSFQKTMHDESRHKAGIKLVLSKFQEKD
ncbi:MAG: rubrerythrin family protein [Candidatus Methanoperedens sp.]|nr:rubrerythrin family protein [Candidatus Methanoperedens sp.]